MGTLSLKEGWPVCNLIGPFIWKYPNITVYDVYITLESDGENNNILQYLCLTK